MELRTFNFLLSFILCMRPAIAGKKNKIPQGVTDSVKTPLSWCGLLPWHLHPKDIATVGPIQWTTEWLPWGRNENGAAAQHNEKNERGV